VQEDEGERRARITQEVKRHLGGVLLEVTDALIGALALPQEKLTIMCSPCMY
jgi:hypothetical protein